MLLSEFLDRLRELFFSDQHCYIISTLNAQYSRWGDVCARLLRLALLGENRYDRHFMRVNPNLQISTIYALSTTQKAQK